MVKNVCSFTLVAKTFGIKRGYSKIHIARGVKLRKKLDRFVLILSTCVIYLTVELPNGRDMYF